MTHARVIFATRYTDLHLFAAETIFRHEPNGWVRMVEEFPELAVIQEWQVEQVEILLKGLYDRMTFFAATRQQAFTQAWQQVEGSWFKMLATFFNDPEEKRDLEALIGLMPLCPRDITRRRFLVYASTAPGQACHTVAHESSHYYFYEGYQRWRPDEEFREIINSKRIWLISELLVPLLFSWPTVQKLLPGAPRSSYACHQRLVDRAWPLAEKRWRQEISISDFFEQIFALEITPDDINAKYFS